MSTRMLKGQIVVLWFYFVTAAAGLALVSFAVLDSCTKEQRAIVRTVVDLVDDVCGDKEDVDVCLSKMQLRRASMQPPKDAGSDQ